MRGFGWLVYVGSYKVCMTEKRTWKLGFWAEGGLLKF